MVINWRKLFRRGLTAVVVCAAIQIFDGTGQYSAVTNNIIKVSDVKIVPVPFETNGEAGLMYKVTLKASIDPEGIYDFIERDDMEKITIVRQNNDVQDAIAKNDALIEDLKEQYKPNKFQNPL